MRPSNILATPGHPRQISAILALMQAKEEMSWILYCHLSPHTPDDFVHCAHNSTTTYRAPTHIYVCVYLCTL